MRLSYVLLLIVVQINFCFAVIRPYPEDLNGPTGYKVRALISNYSFQDLSRQNKGVMTLAFKKLDGGYEHTALMFEVINPRAPTELTLLMVHYGGDDMCCGRVTEARVDVEPPEGVLTRAYRAQNVSDISGAVAHQDPSYTKYASWILPTASLIKGIQMGEQDSQRLADAKRLGKSADVGAKHCVNYAAKIMREVGLQKVDFWWWRPNTPSALKELTDKYIEPKPSKIWNR